MARVKAQTDVKLEGKSISINPKDTPRTKLGNKDDVANMENKENSVELHLKDI